MASTPSARFGRPLPHRAFQEYNESRKLRPIIWKARNLGGVVGPVVRTFTKAPEAANKHWGVQIGDYLYEIHTDEGKKKYVFMQRRHADQIWVSDVRPKLLGCCSLTDDEVRACARKVEEAMQCSKDFQGAYNAVYNNCQSFVTMLVRDILCHKDSEEGRGFQEILSLRRCEYEKRRHDSWEPFWREIPGYLKAWTVIFIENAKWTFTNPGQHLRAVVDPRAIRPRLLPSWSTAIELGKAGFRRPQSVEHSLLSGIRYTVGSGSDFVSLRLGSSYLGVEPVRRLR